jgi:predicted RNA-binding protein with PUA-like domain
MATKVILARPRYKPVRRCHYIPSSSPSAMATSRRPRRYWLVKSEPNAFSFDDLLESPDRTTCWDGVRNYQARNFMRDDMKVGDLVFFYHSSAEPTAIVGVAEVVRDGYPDHTAFDPADPHFDPKSKADSPTWIMVDLRAIEKFARPLSLSDLRGVPGLERMALLQQGSRLSVQPVTAEEWAIVHRLGTGKNQKKK